MLGAGVAFATLVDPGFAATGPSEHARAAAALTDIKAAITTVMAAENGDTSGPEAYTAAAHSAINALVGRRDPAYDAQFSSPGDAIGAIGQVNNLLDHEANPPFVPALHGVLVNVQSAVASLQDAVKARGLNAFETATSDALQNLEIAQGRSDQYDVLGGMMGAIANTRLAVPDGAATEDGCATPKSAGYGVTGGWLVWHAVTAATMSVPAAGTVRIKQENGMLILYTAAAPMVLQHHCATHVNAPTHAAAATTVRPAATTPRAAMPHLIAAAAKSAAPAGLYTASQATAGKAIYSANCASCHGANLQGVAGPAIAGKDFLTTASKNGYTVSIIRTIVTQNMPLNNPASLSPAQYANVLAYLLASNCYPAGKTAFPQHLPTGFGTQKMATQAHPAGKPNKFGVCPVS